MTTTLPTPTPTIITQQAIEQFLYREARYLDDREFEKWLDCYADDVEYWMPSWRDDDLLCEDPQTEISLVYYPNKGGLTDRVFRIRTERSSATSLPEGAPATTSPMWRSSSVAEIWLIFGSTGTQCISGTTP